MTARNLWCIMSVQLFFPAFDKNGKFSVVVFMDGEEVKIEDFTKDNDGDFIQLVRIQASEQFFPR